MQFAFGAEWQSRGAGQRTDPQKLETLLRSPCARILPMWRGKPQIGPIGLSWVNAQSPVLRHATQPFLYLGEHEDRAVFAADISGWEPDALDRAALAMFADTSIQIHPDAPAGARFGELRLAMMGLPAAEAALAATARAVFNWHRTHRFCAACGQESTCAAGGWERHCPVCNTKHFPRTDPVVIMLVTHGNALLLGRSKGWPDRMYSALAGFVEPGETIEAAVAREVFEETGLRTHTIRYIASQPWPFPNSLMFGCTAQADSTALTLDDELEDARWLSREEVLASWCGDHPDVMPAREGAIAHYLIGQWLAGRI